MRYDFIIVMDDERHLIKCSDFDTYLHESKYYRSLGFKIISINWVPKSTLFYFLK